MKSRYQLVFLFLLLLSSCIPNGGNYKILDFEEFTLEVPADWESFSLQGIDSKVGGITDGKDELVYDYGWYSYNLQQETTDMHRRITTTIDGKPALIVLPIKKGEGVIGLYIEVDNLIKFNLIGRDIKNEARVKRIFESVRFKGANNHIMMKK